MSNFSDFIGGSGGGSLPVNIVLTESQTWVPPADGNICIHLVGGGGGGGASNSVSTSGGAGAYCKKTSLAVTTSSSFTVVVGAGGLGAIYALGRYDAFNGGNTTVAGTGLAATLTANGGVGGTTSASGAGGSASNGTINNTGGAGAFYGGGGVGLTGTGNAGENYSRGGGDCDLIGPPSLIGHGKLFGGTGSRSFYTETQQANYYGVKNYMPSGEFLAGGGSLIIGGNGNSVYCLGGNGGIGGGGGGSKNVLSGAYNLGGNGGNGIVIIQYLPA